MSSLRDTPNIGPVLERNLLEIGIMSPEELRVIGSKEAFLRIRTRDPGACLHMLYGIEGAVRGIPDNRLPQETKEDLKRFYRELFG